MAKHKTKPGIAHNQLECCSIKHLPEKHRHAAAKTAIEINPANAPQRRGIEKMARDLNVEVPQMIAMITSKYWGAGGVKLGVAFMENTTQQLQNLIIEHMNAWGQYANVVFFPSNSGQVRISRKPGGYWSYLGTDILSIPKNQPTMNLEGFTLNTPLSEYRRVIRHETGHTLGFPHEHMRREIVQLLDPAKTIAYFEADQGWSEQEIQNQVLTPLDEATLLETPADVNSIMCYQLPGSITKTGQPIPGGLDIDASDGAFCAKLYPKAQTPPPPPPPVSSSVVTIDAAAKTVTAPADWKQLTSK